MPKAGKQQPQYETREQWLNACADLFRPVFKAAGQPLRDTIRISCAFPKRGRGKAIGQHWPSAYSADKHNEIFISPVLDEPLRVADVVAHELIHTHHSNHAKGKFGVLAKALDLEGPLTATHGGDAFKSRFGEGIAKLGPYPHKRMSTGASPTGKQKTRLLKCECKACGYIARVTLKWINDAGAPICPEDEIALTVTY